MPHQLENIADALALLKIQGSVGSQERLEICADTAHFCNTNSLNRLLVDHRESVIDSLKSEHYRFGLQLAETVFPDEMQIGVLIGDNDPQADEKLFSISVAQSRGTPIRHCLGRESLYDGTAASLKSSISTIESELDRVRAVSGLFQDTTHDPLTTLLSRSSFEWLLRRAIQNSPSDGEARFICMAFADLDQFKLINETCGRTAGDEFLKRLGMRLRTICSVQCRAARLGGDEFGFLIEGNNQTHTIQIASDVHAALEQFEFEWEGRRYQLGASFGVADIIDPALSVNEILRRTEIACHMAKLRGRHRLQWYREDDSSQSTYYSEIDLGSKLPQVIADGALQLWQQLIEPTTGPDSQARFEILVRFDDRSGAAQSASELVAAAEKFDLATSLDRFVVERTLQFLCRNPALVGNTDMCCINLAVRSIEDPEFYAWLKSRLQNVSFDTRVLCFEITEGKPITWIQPVQRLVSMLRSYGCRTALDDFGSGYSSFAYLNVLDFSYLKIDGELVASMRNQERAGVLVRCINDMAHALGMKTIAEWVEDDQVHRSLLEMGVDYVQGFGIHRPNRLELLSSRFNNVT